MAQSRQDFLDRLKKAITTYYTATYSENTDLYAILDMYAAEFASGSQEIETTYDNLFILSANVTKLYDNFGTYFGQSRYFQQDVDTDKFLAGSGSVPAYRKTIDFLMDAAMHGSTVYALKRVVNAFTLMNPDVRELYDISRWKLKAYSGSIGSSNGNTITMTNDSGWRRNELVGAIATLYSGSVIAAPQDGGKLALMYIVTGNAQNTITLGAI